MIKEILKCPFGIKMRFCKYQETRAKDLPSVMQGDLVFLCTLTKLDNCPEFKKMLEETAV